MNITEFTGARRDDGTDPDAMNVGDFCRDLRPGFEGYWILRMPPIGRWHRTLVVHLNGSVWSIVEHDDRTISVSPSMKQTAGDGEEIWHGYLKHGIWTAA